MQGTSCRWRLFIGAAATGVAGQAIDAPSTTASGSSGSTTRLGKLVDAARREDTDGADAAALSRSPQQSGNSRSSATSGWALEEGLSVSGASGAPNSMPPATARTFSSQFTGAAAQHQLRAGDAHWTLTANHLYTCLQKPAGVANGLMPVFPAPPTLGT